MQIISYKGITVLSDCKWIFVVHVNPNNLITDITIILLLSLIEPTQAVSSTVTVSLPSSDVPHSIVWNKSSLAAGGLRCRVCSQQQECGNKFIHLCDDDCGHSYCIHCVTVRDLPSRSQWPCCDCKPMLEVIPRKKLHAQCGDSVIDWNGGETKMEGNEEREKLRTAKPKRPCTN